MASKSALSYGQRAQGHTNPLVRKLFAIAEEKKTNVVLSADLTTTKELLAIADSKSMHCALMREVRPYVCLQSLEPNLKAYQAPYTITTDHI